MTSRLDLTPNSQFIAEWGVFECTVFQIILLLLDVLLYVYCIIYATVLCYIVLYCNVNVYIILYCKCL